MSHPERLVKYTLTGANIESIHDHYEGAWVKAAPVDLLIQEALGLARMVINKRGLTYDSLTQAAQQFIEKYGEKA